MAISGSNGANTLTYRSLLLRLSSFVVGLLFLSQSDGMVPLTGQSTFVTHIVVLFGPL